MASSKTSFENGIASLLNSEKYSDLTITTKNRSFKVHKAIVCIQSRVLAAMSGNGFRKSSTAILPLEHDDLATVERMVPFFYTGKYDQGNPDDTTKDAKPFVGPILMANTLVYSIADKYDIQGLKSLAQAKLENIAFAAWNCKDFPAIVAEVFDTTPDFDLGLRDVVSQVALYTLMNSWPTTPGAISYLTTVPSVSPSSNSLASAPSTRCNTRNTRHGLASASSTG